MDLRDPSHQPRLVGDYILGPRIGSGSFAVVWKSKHRHSGVEVAVKEIDKKQLSPKVSENLLKEISILSTIDHPNIIRLFEAIETKDRIYLVLEYCDGGDLAAYINKHGKVSEAIARHFMRQLAAGLQVLQEKHLIHRDLKPQNLLLTTGEVTPLLKIGDFGFARSLTPQGLADTLCGSPLYMAPEIIRNQKYDAKADLWSVGAILFQLVTGKPPFDGNSQLQLFQNILTSTELQFPQGALEELHPDCVDLCRSLLRQDPVQRLTFTEFFNHNFLGGPRPIVEAEHSSVLPMMKPMVGQCSYTASDERLQLHSGHPLNSSSRNQALTTSVTKSVDVSDSMEPIEKDYVIVNVNAHFASVEAFSYYLESSLQDKSTTRVSPCPSRKSDEDIADAMQTMELTGSSVGAAQSHGPDLLVTSSASSILRGVQGLTILHPSTRLLLLRQYVQALAELSQEKYNAGHFLESFSVELIVLAVWNKAIEICSSWLASASEGELPESSSTNESITSRIGAEEHIDFSRPSSVSLWAEQGFIVAFDRAEKLSYHIRDMNGAAEMPDAMEIIFQKALTVGKSGAVDEYLQNKGSAAASYSKAMLLLSFIVEEATSLPLRPPFSLTADDKKRIQQYIVNLQSRQTQFLMSRPSS
ncbi:serine/threonine-protein kinase ATG1a isoform X2 [Castanea sativa]|uniref:serine/threonine-protein kinase ATG1a isoform X2 n=1 Tax=Castanea sativa TaxID=21020 RepID=UPI003F652322